MKQLMKFYMKNTGLTARARAVQKKTGINPVSFEGFSFFNGYAWYLNTFFYTALLEEPYIQDRIIKKRKVVAGYTPNLEDMSFIVHGGMEKSVALLKKLDDACLKATGSLFPDSMLSTTIPPDGGPIFDLLSEVIKEKATIPIEFTHPIVLALGLQLSKKEKNPLNPRTLTRRDIQFLAAFLCELSEHQSLTKKIVSNIDNEEAILFLMLAIVPEEPLVRLDISEVAISESIDALEAAMDAYEKEPQEVQEILRAYEKSLDG